MFEIFSCQGNVFDIIYSSRVCALLQSALLVVTAAQEICQILDLAEEKNIALETEISK